MTNERQRYIEQLERMLDEAEFTANHEDTEQTHQRIAQGDVDALTAAIAALQRDGELAAAHGTIAEQGAAIAEMLPLAEFGLELKKYVLSEVGRHVICEECGEWVGNVEGSRIFQIAEEIGICKTEKNYRDDKLISYTTTWPNEPSSLKDTAQLAGDHDAAVRAGERRKVLEEVRQIVGDVVDGEPIQPAEIERRIEQLAAQPEEAGK